jgi:murein L,D-transpeptidase YcbB/YkuD
MLTRLAACLGLLGFATPGLHAQEPRSGLSETQLQIEHLLETPRLEISGDDIYHQDGLREAYSASAFEPLWTNAKKITEMETLLLDSANHGLRPSDYHLELIKSLDATAASSSSPAIIAARDLLLSDGLLLYIQHRRYGKVSPDTRNAHFNFKRDVFDAAAQAAIIRRAKTDVGLSALVESVVPTADYYELLRMQLLRYMELAASGGWPEVPPGPTLRKGDRDPRIIRLRERLRVTGELAGGVAGAANLDGDFFDDELVSAVKAFQELNGLESDGLVGKYSNAAMNVPVGTRVDQLRLSLERLRWVAQDAGGEFIAVNIAGFRLSYVRNRHIVWTTRVMVGTPYRQTPLFRSDIKYLEFNPTWTIPPTILREDTLPALKKDPAYLASKNISVTDAAGRRIDPAGIDWNSYRKTVPFTLRQEPGPNNALGKVKFIFPNPYFVFMHDTPHKALFDRPERTFSSGCIRVENALELAEIVLRDQPGFSPADMQELVQSSRTRRVLLDKPLPVLILYLTAAVDDSGKARFYRDIYQRDAAVLAELDEPVTDLGQGAARDASQSLDTGQLLH